jgi:hypothetical protein
MRAQKALTYIARRGAVSVIAGLVVSAFAAGALVLGTAGSTDRLVVGRTIWTSLAAVTAAVAGAGFLACVVVFACFLANDVARAVGPWLVAQRRVLLAPFRAIGWLLAQILLVAVVAVQLVVRSAVVADLVWLARTVGRAMLVGLGYAALVGLCVVIYAGLIAISIACIGESTRIVVATFEDPPRPLAMAIVIGGATVLMYIGLAALTFGGWSAYHWTRAGLRRTASASSRPADAWTAGRRLAP